MAKFVEINAMGDDPCDECQDLDGEVVTRQYWAAHKHPNCKCIAVPVTEADMTKAERKVAEKMKAKNTETDEVVEQQEVAPVQEVVEHKAIDENGEVDVQVAVTGKITGSDRDGKPIQQDITEEALQDIAGALNAENKEILVDKDHQSSREGLDRDTHAMGWLSRFWANAKGLFAKLKLTPTGQALVEGREYRKLSPVFTLDKDGKPLTLESAAFTNTPAMSGIEPILNQKPNEALKMEITKEDLVALIKETVTAMNQAPAEEQEKPIEEEKPAEPKESSEEEKAEEQPKAEEAENACGKEEEKEEAANEEAAEAQEKKEEPEASSEEQPKEVIPEAALNQMPSTPTVVPDAPWKNLHGKELMKYIYANCRH